MALIGSVSNLFNRPLPSLETAKADPAQLMADAAKLGGTESPASTPSIAGAKGIPRLSPVTANPVTSFGTMFDKFVNGVDTTMKTAETEKAKVLTGESTNLHQAMIAMQEASTSFSLMVEVRNKLVDSYQELMRMQV